MDAVVFEPSDDQRQRLHELFADLADTPDRAALVERLIDTLVRVARPKTIPTHPQTFRHVGRRRSDTEIRSILKLLQKARDAVADLSGTSIDRLADQGGFRQPFVGGAERLIVAATEALKVQGPYPPPDTGRPTDQRSRFIASAVLNAFIALTGYDPGQLTVKQRKHTGSAPLLRDVFRILSLPGNPRAMADAAERKWIDMQKTPPSGEGLNTPRHKALSVM